MANSKVSENGKELVIVDTAPATGGYWTNPVSPKRSRGLDIEKLFFSVREHVDGGTTTAVPTLQFKGEQEDGWTEYNNDGTAFVAGDNKVIENVVSGIQWRAGVKEGAFGGDAVILGFNW